MIDVNATLIKIAECERYATSNALTWEQRNNYRRQSAALQLQIVGHVKDLREALQHCQQRTYGDDICDDDDSCGQVVVSALRGVGR